ncbi:MAG: helix-turn-helix transcriptional regulator [Verrucomicrobiota bacterium]
MNKTELEHMTFGEYLRRLRESRNLSQRQAAKAAGISYAYLSQIEGSKRGKRKKGDEHFAPHPQFLKKLADVYHVSAGQLFERAGYLDDKQNIHGFLEEREIDRIFDFVIHDPALQQIFAALDKRAVINRYEALTGKRLITWAGEPETHPSVNKSEFSGLRYEKGLLRADTPNTKLTLKEVAQELECEEAEVKTMIQNNQLRAEEDDFKEWLVEKRDLQKFKIGGIRNWIQTGAKYPVAKIWGTPEERAQQFAAEVQFKESEDDVIASEIPASPTKNIPKKKKAKSRK